MKKWYIILLAGLLLAGTGFVLKAAQRSYVSISGVITGIEPGDKVIITTIATPDGKNFSAVAETVRVQKQLLMLDVGDNITVTGNMDATHKPYLINVSKVYKN